MADERAELTKRVLPHMELAQGRRGHYLDSLLSTPRDSAAGRFALAGNAIITGGTGGLGLVVARAMLQHGLAGLMLLDLNVQTDSVSTSVDALRGEFPSATIIAHEADVVDEAQVHAAVLHAAQALGSVDVLVCMAGIVSCHHAQDHPVSSWRRVLDVNATGSFICAQAVARQMIAQQRGGAIVLTASISAHRANWPQPQAAYNASKAALLMLKSSLAAEWAKHGISVNSISPGYVDTILNQGDGLASARRAWMERNPVGRIGFPDEVAGVVVMLCSRAGSYINGADIIIDGGGCAL